MGIIMMYVEEVIGLVKVVCDVNMLVVILFIVEMDGNLLFGQFFVDVIVQVDGEMVCVLVYYMVNCVYFMYFVYIFDY